jgi:hypothetical protein
MRQGSRFSIRVHPVQPRSAIRARSRGDGGVGRIGERVHQADERRVRHVLVLPVQLAAGRRLLEQLDHQVGRLAQELLVLPVLRDPPMSW